MVTILEDDEHKSLANIGTEHETLVIVEGLSEIKAARIRSPRLVHPEQASDFSVELIEITEDVRSKQVRGGV